MNSFLWSLFVLWAVIYTVRAYRLRASSQSLLPPPSIRPRTYGGRALEISVKNFHLEVRTKALNTHHESLIDAFERPSNRAVRLAARTFYNIGTIFGVLGFIFGVVALAYSSFQLLSSIFISYNEGSQHSLGKRDVEPLEPGKKINSSFAINPIIPGVTVPWSHLPFILFGLFVAQCIHEAGHAIAASIEAVSLHAVGASLTLVLPSAFVSLSSMENYSAAARLRIIAAGAWHNLLLWGFIYFASFSKLSHLWGVLGWRDVGNLGVVVLEVEEYSPLVHHLQPGSLITSLDDTALSVANSSSEDIWSRYLLNSKLVSNSIGKGWCIDVDEFFKKPSSCCDLRSKPISDNPPAAQLSCFIPTHDGDQGHCIDPVSILVSTPQKRCYTASDCTISSNSPAEACVMPDESAQLLRISVSPPEWITNGDKTPESKIVLWNGPREEIWDQVKVSRLAPRHRYIPLWLPTTVSLFFEYLSTLSLSLFIFNLFALPFLDGSHFLSALLDYLGASRVQPSTFYERDEDSGGRDIEFNSASDLESGSRTHDRSSPLGPCGMTAETTLRIRRLLWWSSLRVRGRKASVERIVRGVTISLMCTTVIGMAWSP